MKSQDYLDPETIEGELYVPEECQEFWELDT